MLVSQPPYALAVPTFRFPALAALAGRAPLGGPREVALAMYVAARVTDDATAERGLSQATRAERLTHARQWLSSLALPAAARSALGELLDASVAGRLASAGALRRVMGITAAYLDPPSAHELEQMAVALERP